MPVDDGLPPLRDIIDRHDLRARKSLGQNFLLDLNLTSRIARAAGSLEDCDVLEIGPGPGGLTRALLAEGARRVVAVERDARCLPALSQISDHYPGRLEVLEGDALTLPVAARLKPPVKVIANLPYNVGSALLVNWLTPPTWPPFWDSLTLMFQREVADRITAQPGSKSYGRLSVISQWRSEARRLFDVPPRAFTPAPKVTSAIVHLSALPEPRFPADPEVLQKVVAVAFNQRRKMLRAALRSILATPDDVLIKAGIDPTRRAETLNVEEFCRLSEVVRTYA